MKTISPLLIAEMPIEERIKLVEAIWDSIAEMPEAVEIPDWHKEELKKRLEDYSTNPEEGSSWKDVKKRL